MQLNKQNVLKIITKDVLLDITYYISSEKFNLINRNLLPKWYRKNIPYSIILYCLLFFKKSFSFKNSKLKNVSVVLIAYTKNQRDALSPLLKTRNDCNIFGDYKFGDFVFPSYKAYLFSLSYFFDVYKIYKNSIN